MSDPAMTLDHDDLCRLSRLFNERANLGLSQDMRINEWLKAAIAAEYARPVLKKRPVATDDEENNRVVRAIIAAVTPLIRAQVLEEAAQRIEADEEDYLVRNEIAAMLRALKEQP